MKNFEELAFKAGFTGKDLSNTQFGTSYKHALSDDYKNILNHFNIPLDEDEELDDGCPCGHDGGTSCSAVNCEY